MQNRNAGQPAVQILLVDDRPENLFLLEKVLERPGRQLQRATSGNEALRLMLHHDFAVVLLDVQMPDMDGYETAQLMRSDARGRSVPIIFVTAGDRSDEGLYRGYGLGAVDFIYKPINPEILESKVEVFVELHRSAQQVRALNAALERAQERLQEKIADLEGVNQTLSHDLGAPLRSIQGFAEILAESYAGKLDAEADRHLERIVTGCRRMRQMVDDLFRLLTLGAVSEGFEDVDSAAVLAGVVEDLRADLEKCGGQVCPAAPLPRVHAHPGLLGQIFQNLIVNALKFRRDEAPRVEVGAELVGPEWRFSVRDNGIGIAPEHRDRVFGVFQRLVGKSIPGTGVGLSLVKKAVEKHGGRIWVESEPGQGSTFRFTVPVPTTA